MSADRPAYSAWNGNCHFSPDYRSAVKKCSETAVSGEIILSMYIPDTGSVSLTVFLFCAAWTCPPKMFFIYTNTVIYYSKSTCPSPRYSCKKILVFFCVFHFHTEKKRFIQIFRLFKALFLFIHLIMFHYSHFLPDFF